MTTKETQAKREAAKQPSRDDVHEQREDAQPREGVVHEGRRPTQQSLTDRERADWEGMNQGGAGDDDGGKPTPGANSLAGRPQRDASPGEAKGR